MCIRDRYTAELLFTDGSTAAIGILVGDSAQNAVSPTQVTFDKYDQSPNYSNISITLVMPSGTRLDTVKLGSTVLEMGVDYTYSCLLYTSRCV